MSEDERDAQSAQRPNTSLNTPISPSDEMEAIQSLPEGYRAYLSYVATMRTASRATYNAYRNDIEQFYTFVALKKIDPYNPTHKQLRAYISHLDAERYQPSTMNRKISSIKGLFSWLVTHDYTDQDATESLYARKQPTRLPHRMSTEDITRILKALYFGSDEERLDDPLSYRDQAIFEVMYASGLRISEVCSLKLSDIDLSSARMRVLGKGSKERIAMIHDIAAQSLTRYIHFARAELAKPEFPSDVCFLSKRGKPLSTDAVRKLFQKWCQRAGVSAHYTPHDIRHTFASDMLEGGADLRSVQELLGHSNLSTTQIYTHVSAASLKRAYLQAHPRA